MTSINQAIPAIEKFVDLQIPLMLWGSPGVGKSSLIKQIGEKHNRKVIVLMLSQIEYSDLRGIPYILNGTVNWSIPSFFPTNEDDNSIIFLDEINCAHPSILSAAYQLILDRKIGDYTLPKGVSIVAAGNKIEDNSDLTEMPLPLLNRFAHIEISFDYKSWETYASQTHNSLVLEYLASNKSELMFKPKDQIKNSFNTPRSWHKVSDILNTYKETSDILKNIKTISILIASCIGDTIAPKFLAFLKSKGANYSLDLSKLIADSSYSITSKISVDFLQLIKSNLLAHLLSIHTNDGSIESLSSILKNGSVSQRQLLSSHLDNSISFIARHSDLEFTLSFINFFTAENNMALLKSYMPLYSKIMEEPEMSKLISRL